MTTPCYSINLSGVRGLIGVDIYVVLGLLAALYIAWNLGANDAANPTNMAVGSGAITLRKAILLFVIFATIGAIVQGYMVMKTIGKGVVPNIDAVGALSASVAAGLWVTLSTWKGLPVSTTHSSVGAVLGIGFAYMVLKHQQTPINWDIVEKVVLSWITSPLLAIVLSMGLYLWFSRIALNLYNKGYNVDKIFKYLLLASLAFSAYAYGTNDVGNATGVYVTVISKLYGLPDMNTMFFLALLGSVGIALGAFTWGYRVIRTVGFEITRLDYVTGSAAGLSNALIVWVFSTVPKVLFGYGMPISTTHASVSSIIGVGIAKERSLKAINWKTVGIIIISWLLTVPIAASISFIIYFILTII